MKIAKPSSMGGAALSRSPAFAETHSKAALLLSTQVGHWAAGEAIQKPDIQRSWAPTALRPFKP
jgi:hypothetical protein